MFRIPQIPQTPQAPHTVATGVAKAPTIRVKGTVKGPAAPTVKTVKVRAHTRTVRSKPAQPKPPADPYGAQVRAATDVKYGPLLAGDESQIASSAANALRVGNWYQQAQQQAIQNAQNQRQAAVSLAGQLNAQREVLPQGASPEAAAAAASRGNVGQAFGAQMGLIGQNQANFLQGLGTAQGLAGQQAQGAESQRQGQLREKYAQDRSTAGEYGTVLRGQLQAAADKAAMDQANLQVKQGTLAYLTGNAASEAQNRIAGQKRDRSNVRLKAKSQSETAKQNAISDQLKVNDQALKAYMLAHPELKNVGGTTVAKKYQQGIDRGEAVVRLLHGTAPVKNAAGQVTRPNPFYNLNGAQLRSHRQDLIDMLQTSAKAGKLTKDQATRAVDSFLKQYHSNDLGTIVGNLLKLGSKK